jgi:hypothetical protein
MDTLVVVDRLPSVSNEADRLLDDVREQYERVMRKAAAPATVTLAPAK